MYVGRPGRQDIIYVSYAWDVGGRTSCELIKTSKLTYVHRVRLLVPVANLHIAEIFSANLQARGKSDTAGFQ